MPKPMRSVFRVLSARKVRGALIAFLAVAALSSPAGAQTEAQGAGGADFGASGPAVDGVRVVWDVLFWRPVYVVQLVAGAALLPVAVPIAAASGDWRYGVDVSVRWPYEMAFERPLGQ